MRLLVVLVVLLLAGCAGAPPEAAPEEARLRMLALDGRWPFDAAAGAALLAEANASAPVGALVLGEALGARVLDFVGVDDAAARALSLDAPARGEAVAARGSGLAVGDALALRGHAWPTPYVATHFEMERTPSCAVRPAAKLCFLPELEPGEARLRLRVDEGARDGAFLPDLVELGPGGRPAYWNGSFEAPDGSRTPFTAYALVEGDLVPGVFDGAMAAGEWVVSFRLESAGELAAAGAAGIVRIREPGYLWFDDRLQALEAPAAQARAVMANATPTRAEVRVARVEESLPAGADIMLAIDDARALAGTRQVTALLVELTPSDERSIAAARGPDGLSFALRPRPLPGALALPPATGALVFAAPHDVDLAALPAVEGAGAPQLALAGRAPIGEPTRLGGDPLPHDVLLLAHAGGAVSWGLPPGGRWEEPAGALETLARSRTVALGSPDLVGSAFSEARVEMGNGSAARLMVAIGGVTGGPTGALWTSAALVAGAVQPVAPRVVVPVADGADRTAVAERALAAWGAHGLAMDR